MGISNSRAKICKVKPKEEPSVYQVASPKIITAVRRIPQHQQGIVGQRDHQLPPIKQHIPQIVPSPPDSQNLYVKPIHSIIKAHPPQKAKIWQPIERSTEPPGVSKTYNDHASMRKKGGFLQAQTSLIGEATKKRRSHQRRLEDQRKLYTSTIGNSQMKEIRLVSRPTQRDIFWDETEEQNLDFRELLQPSPPLTNLDAEIKEISSRLKTEARLKDTSDEIVTKSPERLAPQNFIWLEDFRKNELKHFKTWDVLEGQWEPKLWLDTTWKHK
ncbi:hypothetical protein Baya_11375 [Bagarius yarrelli]|uniref:Uncharacterized protein n=1 Tax=Bagarius yarrelli TaxID=175774 RepID=A0A556V011_BAGYA|nr:hypothetical protein Baya_11375 [Bagarius yarrelli]